VLLRNAILGQFVIAACPVPEQRQNARSWGYAVVIYAGVRGLPRGTRKTADYHGRRVWDGIGRQATRAEVLESNEEGLPNRIQMDAPADRGVAAAAEGLLGKMAKEQ
jgi:hypothetical protein